MKVLITRKAEKDLRKAPEFVVNKLRRWIRSVELSGLEETRKIPGYHDEALNKGGRSIRLNKSWRCEYSVEKDEDGKYVLVLTVHNHKY